MTVTKPLVVRTEREIKSLTLAPGREAIFFDDDATGDEGYYRYPLLGYAVVREREVREYPALIKTSPWEDNIRAVSEGTELSPEFCDDITNFLGVIMAGESIPSWMTSIAESMRKK